ncbi:hypothetical protein L7F22_005182 [Adiantum nelumboides]|nr:hypothetical protein [Adiantum nelumboides]
MAVRSLVSTPFTSPGPFRYPDDFSRATTYLLNHFSLVCESLIDLPFGDNRDAHSHLLKHRLPQPQVALTSSVPRPSALGFASFLLGIASTLMLFGSFALVLGLLITPLILPLALISCMGMLLANFKGSITDLLSFFPVSVSSISADAIPLEKLGYEAHCYEL